MTSVPTTSVLNKISHSLNLFFAKGKGRRLLLVVKPIPCLPDDGWGSRESIQQNEVKMGYRQLLRMPVRIGADKVGWFQKNIIGATCHFARIVGR